MAAERQGEKLSQMHDVAIGTATNGQILTYNAAKGKWEPQNPATPVTTLDSLTDVQSTAPTNTQVLQFETSSGLWKPATRAVISVLDDVPDVVLTTPTSGQSLVYNGTNWINNKPITKLDDVPDVAAPAPSSGDRLEWNGSNWVNVAAPQNDLFNANDSLSGNVDITTTTFADVSAGWSATVPATGGVYLAFVTLKLQMTAGTAPIDFSSQLLWGPNTTTGPVHTFSATSQFISASWMYRLGGVAAAAAVKVQAKVSAGTVRMSGTQCTLTIVRIDT